MNGVNKVNGQNKVEENRGKIDQQEYKKHSNKKWRMAVGKTRNGAKNLIEKCRSVSFNQNIEKQVEQEEEPLAPLSSLRASTEVKPKSNWTEHAWSTFIARVEEDVEVIPEGKKLLSTFQKDKFIHFFYHVLDLNTDHVISQEDFDGLNSRVRHYMDWTINHPQYLTLNEVHSLFIEYFLMNATRFVLKDEGFDFCDPFNDATDEEVASKDSVSIDEWVDVWGETVGKARKLNDLPIWLQYYPKTLFDTINRSGSGIISRKELKLFYTAFLDSGKLGDDALGALAEKSYNAMTSNGDADLSYHMYKLSFLNFLLGKEPNGPGQFMFGTVESEAVMAMFPIDYKALNSSAEEREAFSSVQLEDKSKRKSVVV